MNELSLFTGAGGGVLASILLGWRIIGYVEWDEYCQQVIRKRISDGIFDDAPIFGDIREFDGKPWRGYVDVITAGFPCQPFSVAGRRLGEGDERNMWPETLRTIREVRPRYAFMENVPGIVTSGYILTIQADLYASGYDSIWMPLGACDVGARHRRKRIWILAFPIKSRLAQRRDDARWSARGEFNITHSESPELAHADNSRGRQNTEQGELRASGFEQSPPDTGRTRQVTDAERPQRVRWWDTDPADVGDIEGVCIQGQHNGQGEVQSWRTGTGPTQPRLGRVAHGVANRVDRLKAIGNGQVPLVAAAAWCLLRGRIR